MKHALAYLNGRLVGAASAAISVVDSGFVLGAAVTEQVRTFGGRLFHMDDHLQRLRRGLEIIGVDPGLDSRRLAAIAEELVAHNHALLAEGDDLGLSVFVTPGPSRSYAGARLIEPTVCLHTYPLPFASWAEKYRTGQALVVSSVEQTPPQCWPPELKCRSRMHYYLADRQADQRRPGARAVLLDRSGHVTEASTANILMYRAGDGLIAPPQGTVLPGISQAVVTQLAAALGIATAQHSFAPAELASADEVLLTSTPWCLLAATHLDGRPIAGGVPGPAFGRLMRAWSELVGLDVVAQAERFADREEPIV